MITNNPADETAAAVSSPDIAEAIASPERTSMMMKRIMIPNGVRITPIMSPPALLITTTSQKTRCRKRGEPNQKTSKYPGA